MERPEFGVRSSGFGTLLGLAFLLSSSASAAEDFPRSRPDPNPSITVRAYDLAEIGSQRIHGAIKEATAILHKARIESAWVLCAEYAEPLPAVCEQPLAADELALRFVRRPEAKNGALGCTECGTAIEGADGRGAYATLYADCLDATPRVDGLLPSVMLGHLIAHEIGHLLLPGKDHAANGIMRAQMRERDWALAVTGQLIFSPELAERLRAETQARLQPQSSSPSARAALPR